MHRTKKKINDLLKIINAKDEKINQLEHRVDKLEQNSRKKKLDCDWCKPSQLRAHCHPQIGEGFKSTKHEGDDHDICESTMMKKTTL